ncbi:MAG: hypothetical protein ABIN54_06890, partial [candidate division WOR-3 bacterium]
MRRFSVLLVLAGGLWANGQHVVYMCPGEEVTINLILENPKSIGDPYPGDMKDVYLQFWRKDGDWLIGGEEDIWVGTIPNGGSSDPIQIVISSDINEPYEPGKQAWLYYRVMISNGEVVPRWVAFQVL